MIQKALPANEINCHGTKHRNSLITYHAPHLYCGEATVLLISDPVGNFWV